jgi:hypothetical protein
MKKVIFIALIAAFALNLNTANANAAEAVKTSVKEVSDKSVQVNYDDLTQTLHLRIVLTKSEKETVFIQLFTLKGELVFSEKLAVDQFGMKTEIPMAGMADGMYKINVSGKSVQFSDTVKKK